MKSNGNDIKTGYALLDYDGFICKSWFASKSKYHENSDPEIILQKLVDAAIDKTREYYSLDEVIIIPFVSGHTYKKDIYPTYKETREKDEDLSQFREYIISEHLCCKSEQLEADDLIAITISALKGTPYIVFSDDKDLTDVSESYCKINIQSEVQDLGLPTNYISLMCRMLAGDKEDDVKGLPGVGMKTALKLIDTFPSVKNIFEIYKSKSIDIDNALKQVTLIAPTIRELNNNKEAFDMLGELILYEQMDEDIVSEVIIGQVTYLNKIAREVYNDGDTKDKD